MKQKNYVTIDEKRTQIIYIHIHIRCHTQNHFISEHISTHGIVLSKNKHILSVHK